MFKSGPNYTKLKTSLRATRNRLQLLIKEKTDKASQSRKEIADCISAGKEDRARISVKHIVEQDCLVEAMELLEMYCNLLLDRFSSIQKEKTLDPGLEEAIASIIWATPRLQADVQELRPVKDEFSHKYGKEFAQVCKSNHFRNVSDKVMDKLSMQAPPKALVERYMVEIAKSYNVPFEPDPSVMQQDEVLMAENRLSGGGFVDPRQMHTGPPGPASMYPRLTNLPPHRGIPSYPPPAYDSIVHSPRSGSLNFNQYESTGSVNRPPIGGAVVTVASAPPAEDMEDTFPELPTVPSNALPDQGNSVGGGSMGGEDDDLKR